MKGRFRHLSKEGAVAVIRTESTIDVTWNGESRSYQYFPTPKGIQLVMDGRVFDITLTHRERDAFLWNINGRTALLDWVNPRNQFRREAEAGSSAHELTSAMPGRVGRIFVRPGDAVSPGDPLLVLEAMKMENEIKAPRRGVVETVEVKEGQSVETRRLLLTFSRE